MSSVHVYKRTCTREKILSRLSGPSMTDTIGGQPAGDAKRGYQRPRSKSSHPHQAWQPFGRVVSRYPGR